MNYYLINLIQEYFSSISNQENAQIMAAYMKTTMPFYGIRAPERRKIIKQALKQYPIKSQAEYLATIEQFWHQPHREEKYVAIDIARAYPKYTDLNALPLFEKMIREGAWWDFVDDIAIHLVGTILMKHSSMWSILDRWSCDDHLWIRRSVIICQNKFKAHTDKKRLFNLSLTHAHEKDFFIKKAIGWALREYAKTNPKAVQEFIQKNKSCFSKLSYNEAGKYLNSEN